MTPPPNMVDDVLCTCGVVERVCDAELPTPPLRTVFPWSQAREDMTIVSQGSTSFSGRQSSIEFFICSIPLLLSAPPPHSPKFRDNGRGKTTNDAIRRGEGGTATFLQIRRSRGCPSIRRQILSIFPSGCRRRQWE